MKTTNTGPKGIEQGATYALIVGGKIVAARVLGFPSSGGIDVEVHGKKIHVTIASIERRFKGKIK